MEINMVIRKGRLGRVCRKCEEVYIPTGKAQKLCPKCLSKRQPTIAYWMKTQEKINKNE